MVQKVAAVVAAVPVLAATVSLMLTVTRNAVLYGSITDVISHAVLYGSIADVVSHAVLYVDVFRNNFSLVIFEKNFGNCPLEVTRCPSEVAR